MEDSVKRYTSEEKKDYLQQWNLSNKSALSFCKETGLSYPTFRHWQKAVKKEHRMQFVEVTQKIKPETVHDCTQTLCSNIILEKENLKITIPLNVNKQDLYTVLSVLGIIL